MTGGETLRRLVGDDRRFAEDHWGRRPLLHRGAGDFADLLDLPDVDHLVTETLLRLPGMRLVRDGEPLPSSSYTRSIRIGSQQVPGTVRPERVLRHFEAGATIVLQALHRQWGPVARFCRGLELDLTHPVQANAYLTPATSRGFSLHHDTHDVFVIQTHGRKSWRLFDPVVELAGREQKWSKDLGDPGPPTLKADLEPGDVLYIPRGTPHDAEARDEVSIHLTVGVTARTWLDVWRSVMGEAHEHGPFRESLPVGFARDPATLAESIRARTPELVAWLVKAGPEAAESFVADFWRRRPQELSGQLVQLARLDRLGPDSTLRRRPGLFAVGVDGEHAVALVGSRALRMPAWCADALRFIEAAEDHFRCGDLPGLDEESSTVLARRLVREGVLEVSDAPG